jgi:putative Ca2+/H+ antiporter (TMEM165/GDT1 family)
MDLALVATCFVVVFVAELPDKTALASLVLGTRYRPLFVFAGVAAAFAVHVVLAVGAGSLLLLLPHRVVAEVVAVLFAAGAVLMLRRREDAPRKARRAPGTGSRPAAQLPRLARRDRDAGPPAATARDGFWRVAGRGCRVQPSRNVTSSDSGARGVGGWSACGSA